MKKSVLINGITIKISKEKKMTERKFTRGLNKPGMAAQLRETVSQVVRESTVLVRIVLFYKN